MKTLIVLFLVISFNPLLAFCDQSSDAAREESHKFYLKVDNISLYQSHAPCKPHEITYDAIPPNVPAKILLECSIDRDNDVVKISFSSDGNSIVRVMRSQYLKPIDPESVELIKAAVKFYGQPNKVDEGNLLVNYGGAYSVSYSNRFPIIIQNKSGIGLIIKGYPCGDGTFGTEDCKGKGTRFIRYDLIDVSALEMSYRDGEAKFIRLIQGKLKKQKF
jgi:hypothetical protein